MIAFDQKGGGSYAGFRKAFLEKGYLSPSPKMSLKDRTGGAFHVSRKNSTKPEMYGKQVCELKE